MRGPVLAVSLAALAVGCASLDPQAPKVVTAAHSGPVQLAKGDTLVVAIPVAPGDRGRWRAQTSNGTVLQQVGVVDLLPNEVAPGTVGNPNDNVYRFRAAETGSTSLDLAWAADAPAPAPVPVHLDVTVVPRPGQFAEAWAKQPR